MIFHTHINLAFGIQTKVGFTVRYTLSTLPCFQLGVASNSFSFIIIIQLAIIHPLTRTTVRYCFRWRVTIIYCNTNNIKFTESRWDNYQPTTSYKLYTNIRGPSRLQTYLTALY